MSLNPKQKLFVKAYLSNGYNATQAAKAAGYSEHSAREMGSENLSKPAIKAAINRGIAKAESDLEKKAALLGVTRERMIEALGKTAFSDMDEFAVITDRGVKFLPSTKRKAGTGKVIKKLTESTSLNGGSIGLELEPRQPARELLCKMLGWTKETLANPGGGQIQIIIKMPANGREAPAENPPAPKAEPDASGD